MSTWDSQNFYYSGQGVVLLGTRNTATGKPKGLLPMGNCSDLKVNIATTVIEHHESESGNRLTDLRIPTQIKGTITATLEKFNSDVMAIALRGDNTQKLAAAITNEAITGYAGKVTAAKWAQINTQVVKRAATTLTAYVNDATPFDYKVNLNAGSIWINDGSVAVIDKLTTGGTVPTAITVGNPTDVTVATPAGFAVGDKVIITGLTGADAALLNGKAFTTVAGAGVAGHIYLNTDTTGKTITIGVPLSFFDGQALTIDYNYAGQQLVDAITQGQVERFLRFEGLNTADGNSPVVVELFRCLFDPMKDLSLISDGLGQYVLEGTLLSDSLQTTGSKYFRQLAAR